MEMAMTRDAQVEAACRAYYGATWDRWIDAGGIVPEERVKMRAALDAANKPQPIAEANRTHMILAWCDGEWLQARAAMFDGREVWAQANGAILLPQWFVPLPPAPDGEGTHG